MNESLRTPLTEDWTAITLTVCLLSISLCEYFSKNTFMQSWIRYSKKPDSSIIESPKDSLNIPVVGRLLVYTIMISLFFSSLEGLINLPRLNVSTDLKKFLSLWVLTCTYLLVLHYLSKLVAHVCKFESYFDHITAARNFQRGILSYLLYVIYLFFYYDSFIGIANSTIGIIVLFLFLVNFLTLLYRVRGFIIQSPLYFILYLCALEIAPYLLLYKYIIV